MKCYLHVVLVILCLQIAASAYAQQEGPVGPAVNSGLATRLRWVQFEIVGGRIIASSDQSGANMNSTATSADGRRERLSLDLNNLSPNLRYELVENERAINIEVTDGEKILVRNELTTKDGRQSVEYLQNPHQELSLTIESSEGKRTIVGPTLWHLLLSEPEVTKNTLAPTLELLKPGWKLAAVTSAVEEALCQNARLRASVDRGQWDAWITELSQPRFADRQRAERNFIDAGREVLPFLRGLERSQLDAEQWRRVRNVIATLDDQQGDSVDQTVSLLAGDERAWLALLNRDDEAKRRLALEQIQSLTSERVDFDPAGSVEVRAKQLEVLREKLNVSSTADE